MKSGRKFVASLVAIALVISGIAFFELGHGGAKTGSSTSGSSSHAGTGNYLIELYPPNVYVSPGGFENYTQLNVFNLGDGAEPSYTLSTAGLSSGLSATISSSRISSSTSESSYGLTIVAKPNVLPGTYQMTVKLDAGQPNFSANFSFRVDPYVVFMNSYRYYPSNLTVVRGATVTWVNLQGLDVFLDDYGIHNVIFNLTQAVVSPNILQYGTWTYTFITDGTFPYYCSIHPYMRGTIVVTG